MTSIRTADERSNCPALPVLRHPRPFVAPAPAPNHEPGGWHFDPKGRKSRYCVLPFSNPQSDDLEQILFLFLGLKPVLRNLGPASGSSLRVFVDGKTIELVQESRKPNRALAERCKTHREIVEKPALQQRKTC